ncbi:DUF3291 domain-containing protein [Actinoplanes sp. N902-109]|uniref:DUF3291 domain-containing protein n=1 Tax=Actinoplanes sp. (strain N902-109) TaxID=649831 RepID=UPI0003293F8E|nr:DUF3291 domain-containing protein [Actinoplanes sp. N902-109]AGL16813.1 hypothetical protein L083_3303 [Actinoplanes sp. N902-109]
MSTIALYTFGLIDPALDPDTMADFAERGTAIYSASDQAPGFLGQAETAVDGSASHEPGEDFGPWGRYALPTGLPELGGHDPQAHIATLSLWRTVEDARGFVYGGIHREALKHRHDWFFRGPWPGHVLWRVHDDHVPQWEEGVSRLEALARDGESADRFTFGSVSSRTQPHGDAHPDERKHAEHRHMT